MNITQETAATEHATHKHGVMHYAVIYAILLLLTASTFGVAQLLKHADVPGWIHFAAALGIATVKVSLVVLFFMHLKEAEGANKTVFLISVVFVCVLMFFVLEDIRHRFHLLNPQPQWILQPEWKTEPHADEGARGFTGTSIKHD